MGQCPATYNLLRLQIDLHEISTMQHKQHVLALDLVSGKMDPQKKTSSWKGNLHP